MDRYNPTRHTPLDNTRLTAVATALRAGGNPGTRGTGRHHIPTSATRTRAKPRP